MKRSGNNEDTRMLGIEDPWIWMAYILCFISAIGCMINGALKWNEGIEEEEVH
ncbi:MAG: hypothetical protein QCH31_02315 [Methanolobus sp.]|nr:hypothetical protein [Methanolobus sp.]